MPRPRIPDEELTKEQLLRRKRNERYFKNKNEKMSNNNLFFMESNDKFNRLKPSYMTSKTTYDWDFSSSNFSCQNPNNYDLNMSKTDRGNELDEPKNEYEKYLDVFLSSPTILLLALSVTAISSLLVFLQLDIYENNNIKFGLPMALICELSIVVLASFPASKIRNGLLISFFFYVGGTFYFSSQSDIRQDKLLSQEYKLAKQEYEDARQGYLTALKKRESGNMRKYKNDKEKYIKQMKNISVSDNSELKYHGLLFLRMIFMALNFFLSHKLVNLVRRKFTQGLTERVP